MKCNAALTATLALAMTLGSGHALAHENARTPQGGAVKKEQQPWGIAGEREDAKRTVQIAMSDDMRFTPSTLHVNEGETVRFVVTNKGKVLHEMVIGTRKALDEHAALMQKFPGMEHDEPHMAHVSAGRKGELVWKFNRAGDFAFACLIPGHYQAGMVGTIKVAAAK